MADTDEFSSFNESGYFKGPLQIIRCEGLEREANAQQTWLANSSSYSGNSISHVLLTVLQEAVLATASYIHVQPRRSEFIIKYRIGDRLWESDSFPKHAYAGFCARLKAVSSVDIAERRIPQFGRFLYEQPSLLYEMRMSSIPAQFGEAFVINILPQMGHGDYAMDRHEWQDWMTVEDVLAQIQADRQKEAQ